MTDGRRIDGWVDGRIVGWMDYGWMDGLMDGWKNNPKMALPEMGGSVNGRTDRWMGGWVDGWADGWMDG